MTLSEESRCDSFQSKWKGCSWEIKHIALEKGWGESDIKKGTWTGFNIAMIITMHKAALLILRFFVLWLVKYCFDLCNV